LNQVKEEIGPGKKQFVKDSHNRENGERKGQHGKKVKKEAKTKGK